MITIKIGIVLYIIVMTQSFFIIYYIYTKGRKSFTLYSHLVCHVLAFLWLFFTTFEKLTQIEHRWLPTGLALFPVCFIGTSWLVFCISYIGSKSIYNKGLIISQYLLSTLFYVSVLT